MIFCIGGGAGQAQTLVPKYQEPSYKSICEAHTPDLEKAFDLPSGVLTAISRVESGRPNGTGIHLGWPWTINHDGKGLFFDNKRDMLAYARSHIERGDTRMDLGCMQISVFWHGEQFTDLEEMADPSSNIAYAAAFLSDLKTRHGSIDQAIRHYHNADPEANTPYVARVYDIWKGVAGDHGAITPNTASTRAVDVAAAGFALAPASSPVSAAGTPETSMAAAPDPRAAVRSRQPHLHGKWDLVEHFRKMLNP